MKRFLTIIAMFLFVMLPLPGHAAQKSITVDVPTNGRVSNGIQLYPGHKYSIVVYGTFKHKGVSSKASACRAYYPKNVPVAFAQNNLGVNLDCSQVRNNNYEFESKPFMVREPVKITFYIYDSYYPDNSGVLHASVYDFGAITADQQPNQPIATECHSINSSTKRIFWLGDKEMGVRCQYHPNKRLASETPYAHGKMHGTKRTYYRTGNRKSATVYWNGHISKAMWWNEKGKMTSCSLYKVPEYIYLGSCIPKK